MKKLLQRIKKLKGRHFLLILIGVIIYLSAKIYVLNTPTPTDDEIPDKIKDAVLMLIYDDKMDETSYA